jgi:hypothetical protein
MRSEGVNEVNDVVVVDVVDDKGEEDEGEGVGRMYRSVRVSQRGVLMSRPMLRESVTSSCGVREERRALRCCCS